MCTKYEHIPRVRIQEGRLWNDVKFSLIYDGELLSATDKHSRVENKNRIRYELTKQLSPVWGIGDFSRFQLDDNEMIEAAIEIRDMFFVPLLARKMNASCRLSIKFMRAEHPGQIVNGGDLDNRLKTLFDALRLPHNETEVLPGLAPKAYPADEPCVCLLEDDSLITELNVETVMIMTPLQKGHVRLVIDVEFRPLDFQV